MRYAVYHLPQGDLGHWGSAWLGWDARKRHDATAASDAQPKGEAPPRRNGAALPRTQGELTATPRRYGFHATMKAPMHLAEGRSLVELRARLGEIAATNTGFAMEMALNWDWGFLALRPLVQPPELMALEAALVTGLDDFRAPLSEQDRARRHPERLSPTAREHLDRWGYPHVLDLFHYHLTLSGAITEQEGATLAQAFEPELAPLLARPMPVAAIALVAEGPDKHFRLIEEFPLEAGAG